MQLKHVQLNRKVKHLKERKPDGTSVPTIVFRVVAVVATLLLALFITLAGVLLLIFRGPSPSARDLMTMTLLETNNMRWLPRAFLSEADVSEIVSRTQMKSIDTGIVDRSMVDATQETTVAEGLDPNGIQLIEIEGRTFSAKLLVVNDPSRVHVGSTYPVNEGGKDLAELAVDYDAIAAVNGGLYDMRQASGGSPIGPVISYDALQWPNNDGRGNYFVAFDQNNMLRIIDISYVSTSSIQTMVQAEGLRDGICYPDEATTDSYHFCPLIVNGTMRQTGILGSGANPRTAIGQRADGAVLLLTCDGRGVNGHLGATASDIASIMREHGAINAANIDGGSASQMIYQGEYVQRSHTFLFANTSWKVPTAIVVESR